MDNTQHPYTIELLGMQVTVNKNTYQWNLKYDNLTAILSNPMSEVAEGTQLRVNAVLHHNIGYDYYLENATVPYGYRTNDCEESIVSPPTVQTDMLPLQPIPVIQPAPMPKPAPLPSAPVTMPSSTETYFIRRTIPKYPHHSLAFQHKSDCGKITMGQYYVWRKFNDMVNVTDTPGQSGYWINPADNRIIEYDSPDLSQKPISWKDSYQAFAEPKSYQVNTTIIVRDLAGQRKDKRIYTGQFYDMAGEFTGPDGYNYCRPEGAAIANLWYGIEPQYLTLEDELYNTEQYLLPGERVRPLNMLERIWAHAAHISSLVPKAIELLKNKQEKK